ncbi:MAG TPA: Asp-tRNA(Asn)/Glu-tRNA(Gln) amidotransferase subunit GatA [Terriglobales bacterium]|nr:Asp-tRNA(Asn)/Glu-tRNA(Gln) amidotransferase subunit GatA [Terriglobales bacterium]
MKLYEKSAGELGKMLREGDVSATEITKSYLRRIDEVEGKVDAFLTVTRDAALEMAALVDRKLAAGEAIAPLAGIPIAVKDNICVDGVRTTCASKILENFVPPYDATVVTRMKNNLMPIIGKTNLDEFAMGSSCENSAFKPTHNPYDLTRVPGGSSGGSAASVAAGESVLSVGTDTGGSVRLPACLNGIVGLKPTYGAVSRSGVVAFGSSLDQVGPFGRTVADCAMLFDAIAGRDPYDATSTHFPYKPIAPGLKNGVRGLKIGLPREFFGDGIDPAVRASIIGAAKTYEEMGATLVDVDLPFADYALATYYIISSAEASSNLARFDGVKYGLLADGCKTIDEVYFRSRSEGFGPEVLRRIMLGTYVLASGYYDAYYKQGQKMREKLKQVYADALSKCDVMLTPTSPTVAFKLGEKATDPVQMYLSDICTVSINMVQLPALVVPCAQVDGLPMGFQLIGRKNDEELLFNVAYSYEQTSGIGWVCPKL